MIYFRYPVLYFFFLWFITVVLVHADDLVGKRLKLTGKWTGESLEVSEIQKRDSNKDPEIGQVQGPLESVDLDNRSFYIGPLHIEWDDDTEFVETSQDSLKNDQVLKVKGRLTKAGVLVANTIEGLSSELDEFKVIGAVTESKIGDNGRVQLVVLSIPANVSGKLLPQSALLTNRLDDNRPDEQLTLPLFGKPLTIGGELELETKIEKDFEFDEDNSDDDDLLQFEPGVQLEFLSRPTENIAIFVEGELAAKEDVLPDGADKTSESEIKRGESWVYFSNILETGFSLRVGRQSFEEERTWWWDSDLDSVRVYYDHSFLSLELGLAQELARETSEENRIDPEQEDVFRILSRAELNWGKDQRIETFFLYQNDHSRTGNKDDIVKREEEDDSDADLIWLGLRSSGRIKLNNMGRFYYWLDGAYMVGNEILIDFDSLENDQRILDDKIDHDVEGWGADAAFTWQTKLPFEPTFTIGYAIGSGDKDPESATDNAFRQTGLHGNNGKFRGVDRFRYYGELLRPELSNLEVWTASLGFGILEDSSIEIVYHHYQQVKATDFLRDGELDADPTGKNRDIGDELDIVLGIEEWEHWEIEIVGAIFWAGDAYGSFSNANETAKNLIFKINYNF